MCVLTALLALTATPAHAVSVADIEQLARAGLGDEVLVALVQTDNTVFPLDAPQILALRAAGVSERVIVAMLRNGRSAPVFEPPALPYDDPSPLEVPPAPAPVVVEVHTPASPSSVAAPVLYAPPPIVAVPRGARRSNPAAPSYRGFGRFINDGWVDRGGSHRTSP
jgi:hypothetical protein